MIKKNRLILAALFSLSVIPNAVFADMKLTLTGSIDLTKNPSITQYIQGYLSGDTMINKSPVYHTYEQDNWNPEYALIALSSSNYKCDYSYATQVPGRSNTWGIKLTHETNASNSDPIYVTPNMKFNIILSDWTGPYYRDYSGQFFTYSSGLSDRMGFANTCFVPSNTGVKVPPYGRKKIEIYSPSGYPVYLISPVHGLKPGRYISNRNNFYIASYAATKSNDVYSNVIIETGIVVKRFCQLSNITNQNITENMTAVDEIIRDSTFTVSCPGDVAPLMISARIKEGTIGQNLNKLILAPINNTNSESRPWVMGFPYKVPNTTTLTCADENRSDLLKFDDSEMPLGNISMGTVSAPQDFGIKWAICKPQGVKAGEYRGIVDVSVYVKG